MSDQYQIPAEAAGAVRTALDDAARQHRHEADRLHRFPAEATAAIPDRNQLIANCETTAAMLESVSANLHRLCVDLQEAANV